MEKTNKKKIGILTFHRAENYGAVLQCYALLNTLKGMGMEVEVIDYFPKSIKQAYKIWEWKKIKPFNLKSYAILFFKQVFSLNYRIKRKLLFSRFIKNHITLSPNFQSNKQEYDLLIMGSDQIWNPILTHGFDPYFTGYIDNEIKTKKCITYAVSYGNCPLTDENLNYLKDCLKNFKSISVREKSALEVLNPLTDNNIYQVLDPTLLLPARIWDDLACKDRLINEKYILIYQVIYKPDIYKAAAKIAKQYGAKIVEIKGHIKLTGNGADKVIQVTSPNRFVELIRDAECVITSSFHGTAFSIIYKKDFYFHPVGDQRDERSKSLLQSLKLTDRIINDSNQIEFCSVNYKEAEVELKKLKEESLEFLTESCKLNR